MRATHPTDRRECFQQGESRSVSVSPAGSGKATTIPLSRTTTPYTLAGALEDIGQSADKLNKPQFEHALKVLTEALHDATPGLRGALDVLDPACAALEAAIATGHSGTKDDWRAHCLLVVARLIARGALRREESRGGHWRSDFPERDEWW